jgi:hypothetical protein
MGVSGSEGGAGGSGVAGKVQGWNLADGPQVQNHQKRTSPLRLFTNATSHSQDEDFGAHLIHALV